MQLHTLSSHWEQLKKEATTHRKTLCEHRPNKKKHPLVLGNRLIQPKGLKNKIQF